MKEVLIHLFNNACENYYLKKDRGYKFGFFSTIRHSFTKTPQMELLEKKLQLSANDEEALSTIIEHLLEKGAKFNNHSFNSYLIDELQKLPSHKIEWACFTPRAIKTYQGVIYRGTSQPPHKIFSEGFKELVKSNWVEDYLKFRNYNIGISTSKDFDCAKSYALNNKRSNIKRYIYMMNYRSEGGYDLLETGKARGLSFNALLHIDRNSGWRKNEVNVKNNIVKEDIIGAWEIQKDDSLLWHENPNYSLDYQEKKQSFNY